MGGDVLGTAFLDLKKAFNTINHSLLLPNWFASSLLNIQMGIPQGSIRLCINDLPLNCPGASFQLYAADAVLYAPAKSRELVADVVSACVADVRLWLNQNQLVLNLTKTVYMGFSIEKLDLKEIFKINLQNKK